MFEWYMEKCLSNPKEGGKKSEGNKWQTNNKMVEQSPNIWITLLTVGGLNTPIKTEIIRLDYDITACCL
jgi:hypothetical protein